TWGTTAPQRWGWMAYKWKLDNGPWSAEIGVTNHSPFTNPPSINLAGISEGLHTLYVSGKNDAPPGYYQDDTFVYPPTAGIPAEVTASRTWLARTNAPVLRINEILTRNDSAVPVGANFSDLVALYNSGTVALDLSGVTLADQT